MFIVWVNNLIWSYFPPPPPTSGHLELCCWLLDKTQDPDPKDQAGWTPLIIAASAGHTSIVLMLLGESWGGLQRVHFFPEAKWVQNDNKAEVANVRQ